ncbi:MAG: NAD(P)/FAD-dependent oxidoreductase [Saprospiraceae bacterium]
MENIIVIGGGLMGTSVTWKLAEQGEKVLLLEQQGKDYDNGSSYGAARISRSLGPKKDVFSFVHNRTVKEVEKLIHFLNKEKIGGKHQMEDIYSTSPVSYLFKKEQYEQINQFRYKKQRYDYKRGSGSSAFRKFGVTLKPDEVLVREYRKHSGTINPGGLIQKLRLGIAEKGGNIKFNTKVVSLIKKEGVFEVTILNTKTNKTKTISAKKVVVAAGPYTVSVLKQFAPYFNRIITPKRVLLAYYKIADKRFEEFSEIEKKSIFAAQPMFSQIGKEYFSMIEKLEEDGAPIIKAGFHKVRRNILDLDKVWDLAPRKKEIKKIKKQFRKYFEMLEIFLKKKEIELVDAYNCVYSETRTHVPLVTHIKNKYGSLDRDIVVIGGMSGVGAKGCLGYGTIGANLITGKEGESSKIYRRAIRAFGSPGTRLQTRRIRRGRLF